MTDISPLMIGAPETGLYKRDLRPLSIFDRSLIVPAIWASFRKLDPRTLVKKPVMFCVEIVSVLTTIFFLRDRTPISRPREAHAGERGCLWRKSATGRPLPRGPASWPGSATAAPKSAPPSPRRPAREATPREQSPSDRQRSGGVIGLIVLLLFVF